MELTFLSAIAELATAQGCKVASVKPNPVGDRSFLTASCCCKRHQVRCRGWLPSHSPFVRLQVASPFPTLEVSIGTLQALGATRQCEMNLQMKSTHVHLRPPAFPQLHPLKFPPAPEPWPHLLDSISASFLATGCFSSGYKHAQVSPKRTLHGPHTMAPPASHHPLLAFL